jgi:hypothetical protein
LLVAGLPPRNTPDATRKKKKIIVGARAFLEEVERERDERKYYHNAENDEQRV